MTPEPAPSPTVQAPEQPGDVEAFKRVVAAILVDHARQTGVQSSQEPRPAKGTPS